MFVHRFWPRGLRLFAAILVALGTVSAPPRGQAAPARDEGYWHLTGVTAENSYQRTNPDTFHGDAFNGNVTGYGPYANQVHSCFYYEWHFSNSPEDAPGKHRVTLLRRLTQDCWQWKKNQTWEAAAEWTPLPEVMVPETRLALQAAVVGGSWSWSYVTDPLSAAPGAAPAGRAWDWPVPIHGAYTFWSQPTVTLGVQVNLGGGDLGWEPMLTINYQYEWVAGPPPSTGTLPLPPTGTPAPGTSPLPGGTPGCGQWDVSGRWTWAQSNASGVWVLAQDGTALTGVATATIPSLTPPGATGTIAGTLVGNQFDVEIAWSFDNGGHPIGRYQGVVGPDGIAGSAFDEASPNSRVAWSGSGPTRCVSVGSRSTISATSRVSHFETTVAGDGCLPPPAGLVGWWPGEGNAGDVVGGNDGQPRGGTAFAPGVVGQGFRFDGRDGVVVVPDSPRLKPARLTVEGWVRFDALDTPGAAVPGLQYLVFKQNTRATQHEGYALLKVRTGGADRISLVVASATGSQAIVYSKTAVVAGVWYHLAGTIDGSSASLYVNGVPEESAPVPFPLNYGATPLFFGTSGTAFDGKFQGVLDEVSIYDRALSPDEVQSIVAAAEFGKCG